MRAAACNQRGITAEAHSIQVPTPVSSRVPPPRAVALLTLVDKAAVDNGTKKGSRVISILSSVKIVSSDLDLMDTVAHI